MKIKFCFFATALALIFLVVNCIKKTEPANKFVGNYTYSRTATGMAAETGSFRITKTSSKRIKSYSNVNGSKDYSVDGNSIAGDEGVTVVLPQAGGGATTYNESASGCLNGKTLALTGSWRQSGFATIDFTITAIKN